MKNVSHEEGQYDFIVVGAGAAGSVLAAELSASGANVLVIESGGPDNAPTPSLLIALLCCGRAVHRHITIRQDGLQARKQACRVASENGATFHII
jgi:choline dehydrogenase-like flavoprotein